MPRIVREPFTFSDGTYLPRGTYIGVPAHAIHLDESNYLNLTSFVPFRFVDGAGGPQGRHGRHACFGRFFEVKLMLALIVMKYDVKLESPRLENMWVLTVYTPNPKGEVLFRKRVTDRD